MARINDPLTSWNVTTIDGVKSRKWFQAELIKWLREYDIPRKTIIRWLKIGEYAIDEYLITEAAIPKHVGIRMAEIMKVWEGNKRRGNNRGAQA